MDHSKKKTDRPPYGIIAVLMIGAFISFLNNTLLNIALPSIMKDLEIGPSTVQWLTTGFMLVNGILIPTYRIFNSKIFCSSTLLSSNGLIYTRNNSCRYCSYLSLFY